MLHSEQIDKIAGALAKAQSAFINPPRNRTVTVKTQSSGSYEFSYATFDAIIECVRKPLAENELSYTQTVEIADDGKPRVVTTLMHSSGQWIGSTLPLMVDRPGNQAFGSALTYGKRYALTALLGIAADEDDDANSADGNGIERKTDRTPPQVKTAAPAVVPPKPPMTAKQWADGAIKTVKAMTTAQGVADWQFNNSADLERLAAKAQPEYVRVFDTINERLAALRPQQAAE